MLGPTPFRSRRPVRAARYFPIRPGEMPTAGDPNLPIGEAWTIIDGIVQPLAVRVCGSSSKRAAPARRRARYNFRLSSPADLFKSNQRPPQRMQEHSRARRHHQCAMRARIYRDGDLSRWRGCNRSARASTKKTSGPLQVFQPAIRVGGLSAKNVSFTSRTGVSGGTDERPACPSRMAAIVAASMSETSVRTSVSA